VGEHVKNGKVDRIPELLVAIPRLDELNPAGKHPIDDTMFLVNSPAPAAGELVL
jgi:hypothetical protein